MCVTFGKRYTFDRLCSLWPPYDRKQIRVKMLPAARRQTLERLTHSRRYGILNLRKTLIG